MFLEETNREVCLILTPVPYFLQRFRPYYWGTWEETAQYFSQACPMYMFGLAIRVMEEGIGFADEYAPILVGHDSKVWDGHHRIVVAYTFTIRSVLVDRVHK